MERLESCHCVNLWAGGEILLCRTRVNSRVAVGGMGTGRWFKLSCVTVCILSARALYLRVFRGSSVVETKTALDRETLTDDLDRGRARPPRAQKYLETSSRPMRRGKQQVTRKTKLKLDKEVGGGVLHA